MKKQIAVISSIVILLFTSSSMAWSKDHQTITNIYTGASNSSYGNYVYFNTAAGDELRMYVGDENGKRMYAALLTAKSQGFKVSLQLNGTIVEKLVIN